jgi:putative component of membrane protein insertase Oxa1/YidC/SpoIIIJ protein YidD
MIIRPLPALTIAAIHRYRRSDLAARSTGCCRFAPSCSHYAEEALRRRAYPVALALIAWRILRCRPGVPYGSWDPVPRGRPGARRRWSAVLLLSAIMTFGTLGLAEAVTPLVLTPTVTQGGCTASIDGTDIGRFNRKHPLFVQKGQSVVVFGNAPQTITTKPEPAGATTSAFVDVELMSPFSKGTTPKVSKGYKTFTSVTNVDDYLKYGSGLYRVTAHASGAVSGARVWTCAATFYATLDGGAVPGYVGGALGGLGLLAAATAAGKTPWAPGDIAPDDGQSGVSAKELVEQTGAEAYHQIGPDPRADRSADIEALFGCLGVLCLFLFDDASGLLFNAAVARAGQTDGRRVWRRGHPVRGFLGGLVAGWGLVVFLQQRGYTYFTWRNVILYPLILAIVGGWRGWRGRAFRVTARPAEEAG